MMALLSNETNQKSILKGYIIPGLNEKKYKKALPDIHH